MAKTERITDAIQPVSAAEVLRGQLLDVLVDVPATDLAKLTDREKFMAFDWSETARECVARQGHVPLPEIAVIRRWMRPEQLAGTWSAFTTWRPVEQKKEQRGLFA